jgi:hypothetical protein
MRYRPAFRPPRLLGIDASGDGNGRVTTSPSGIDCAVSAGVGSGACSHTWYFVDSLPFGFTHDPGPAS